MLGEKHDLIHEFPEHRKRIHEMKLKNHHFSKLFDEYHELEHHIRRIENDIEPTTDEFLETLKKKRLLLKDQLYGLLTA